jgi:ankyrin repeat protein
MRNGRHGNGVIGMNLHQAIRNGASLEFMEQLIKKHPESLFRKELYGTLPFHTAIKYIADPDEAIEVLELFLAYDPEAATRADNYGNLPLHLAADVNSHMDVIERVLDAFPPAAVCTNHVPRQQTPLHFAVSRENVAAVRLLLQRYPHTAQLKDHEDALPLHLALLGRWSDKTQRTEEIVRLLLEAYPGGTEEAICKEYAEVVFPIHFACMGCYSRRIFQMLLEANPDSVHYLLCHGGESTFPPLHVAVEANCDSDVIELLIDLAPGALQTWSTWSDSGVCSMRVLPLHIALKWCCRYPSSIDLNLVQLLIDRCPESLAMDDGRWRSHPASRSCKAGEIQQFR